MLRIEECKPGALVECIRADGLYRISGVLQLGAVYTIKGTVNARYEGRPEVGVLLEELLPPIGHTGFVRDRFRLLREGDDGAERLTEAKVPEVV